jgi:hypothetical protein
MGAAMATVLGFGALAGATWHVTQRIFRVEYEWGRLASLFGLATAIWLLSRALPLAAWAWPVKLLLLALWPWSLWKLGLVSQTEKQYLFHLLRETRLWFRPKAAAPSMTDSPTEPQVRRQAESLSA